MADARARPLLLGLPGFEAVIDPASDAGATLVSCCAALRDRGVAAAPLQVHSVAGLLAAVARPMQAG